MTIELDSTLAQAEVLFVSFSQIVADIDRRQAERDAAAASSLGQEGLRRRPGAVPSGSGSGSGSSSKSEGTKSTESLSNVDMPEISEYLRELLDSGDKKQRTILGPSNS